jgi:hypothetical protein
MRRRWLIDGAIRSGDEGADGGFGTIWHRESGGIVSATPRGSVTVWSGIELAPGDGGELAGAGHEWYEAYRSEVLGRDRELSSGRLYERIDDRRPLPAGRPARPGTDGTKYLTEFVFPERHRATGEATPPDGRSIPFVPDGPEGPFATAWSAAYRYLAETAPAAVEPYAIYMVGVDVPSGFGAGEFEQFDDFYTNVHMPEVAARRRCLRASRYERVEVQPAGEPQTPQFIAIYELDEAGAARRRHVGGAYSAGPPVWKRHTNTWRFWYRLVAD